MELPQFKAKMREARKGLRTMGYKINNGYEYSCFALGNVFPDQVSYCSLLKSTYSEINRSKPTCGSWFGKLTFWNMLRRYFALYKLERHIIKTGLYKKL